MDISETEIDGHHGRVRDRDGTPTVRHRAAVMTKAMRPPSDRAESAVCRSRQREMALMVTAGMFCIKEVC